MVVPLAWQCTTEPTNNSCVMQTTLKHHEDPTNQKNIQAKPRQTGGRLFHIKQELFLVKKPKARGSAAIRALQPTLASGFMEHQPLLFEGPSAVATSTFELPRLPTHEEPHQNRCDSFLMQGLRLHERSDQDRDSRARARQSVLFYVAQARRVNVGPYEDGRGHAGKCAEEM